MAEAERRIAAIVGNQHRGVYDRAAILAVACAEVLELTDGIEATKFFDRIKNNFSRYRAFQSELKRVKQSSLDPNVITNIQT